MERTTADCPRRFGARAVFAAVALAAIAAAPAVALTATDPGKATISAEPNDVDYSFVGDPGAGGGGGG
jgi:hypothetical protein